MAIFKDTTITDNGRALIADTLANNKQIIFTRMITSSKIYEDSTDVSKLTNIDELFGDIIIDKANGTYVYNKSRRNKSKIKCSVYQFNSKYKL